MPGHLCEGCGLCCDGSLFELVPLLTEEASPVALKLPVIARPDKSPAFAQPCPMLSGTLCRIYAGRPDACRRYRCNLLVALEANEVSAEEALREVREAQRLISEVEEALPEDADVDGSTLQRARKVLAQGLSRSPELRARRLAAEKHLDRHFRGRTKAG